MLSINLCSGKCLLVIDNGNKEQESILYMNHVIQKASTKTQSYKVDLYLLVI